MPRQSIALRETFPAFGAAASLVSIFLAVLSIPLSVGTALTLSDDQVSAWILALYGGSGLLTVLLVSRFRQPLLMTGNVFILIFVSRLGSELPWPELVGASMVAGAAVLVLGPLGLTRRLARLLPAPIVFGLLAGAVLPFFVRMFTVLGEAKLTIGAALAAYMFGRLVLEPRVPAILVALVTAVLVAALRGAFGPAPPSFTLPALGVTAPELSLRAIVTATPVMVVLMTVQANVPSVVFLRSQRYEPPERILDVVSGLGTLLGSLLGPMGMSLSLPATALCAGEDAGPQALRHRAAYLAGVAALAIGLLAGYAPDLRRFVPGALLAAIVGLAVVGVLSASLQQMTKGPLLLGPLFAFAIALSDLELFGLGAFFWALVLGLLVSRLLEHEGWQSLQRGEKV